MTTGLARLIQPNAVGGKIDYTKELGVSLYHFLRGALNYIIFIHQYNTGRRKRLQQIEEIDGAEARIPAASLGNSDRLQKLALDHVSGRQRMPITLRELTNLNSLWDILETLGDCKATFAVWAEIRAWRRWELLCDHPSSDLCRAILRQSPSAFDDHFEQPAVDALVPAFDSTLSPNEKDALHRLAYQKSFQFALDHRISVVVQHNCLQGMLANMAILIRLNGDEFQGWDNFYTEDLPCPPENSPPSLHFTHLQKTVTHEAWIDTIPWASMRDNVIKYQDKFDADELCSDFLGGFEEGINGTEGRGMILWGDPWCGSGWELSENFIRKWRFLLQGGSEIIAFTNRWRAVRGEKRLVIEV